MKIWNAPEMEELDVRMTLYGTQTGYAENTSGFAAYCNSHWINYGSDEEYEEAYRDFLKLYSTPQS